MPQSRARPPQPIARGLTKPTLRRRHTSPAKAGSTIRPSKRCSQRLDFHRSSQARARTFTTAFVTDRLCRCDTARSLPTAVPHAEPECRIALRHQLWKSSKALCVLAEIELAPSRADCSSRRNAGHGAVGPQRRRSSVAMPARALVLVLDGARRANATTRLSPVTRQPATRSTSSGVRSAIASTVAAASFSALSVGG